MDKIYILIGQLLQSFQKIEEYLSLSIFFLFDEGAQGTNLKDFLGTEDKTFGAKLASIRNLQFFKQSDLTILEYIKNQRNYIAHHYFLEHSFICEQDIVQATDELSSLLKDTQLIECALKNCLKQQKGA